MQHSRGRISNAFVSDIRRRYKYFFIGIIFSDCYPTYPCEMSDDVRFRRRILGSNPVVPRSSEAQVKLDLVTQPLVVMPGENTQPL